MAQNKIEFARPYFANEPTKQEGFITNDPVTGEFQFLFWNGDQAHYQAKCLREAGHDATVTTVTREELSAGKSAASGGDGDSAASAEAAEVEMFDVTVTEEILEMNPDLREQGVQVGEVIQVPVDDTQNSPEEIAEDVKTAVATKTVKKKSVSKPATKKATSKKK